MHDYVSRDDSVQRQICNMGEAVMYKIYGDYGMSTEYLLEEFDWLQEARDWLRGYTRWGDFGGYDSIYIVDEFGGIYQAVYAKESDYA